LIATEKERKSKLGNVKFIGELFKFKLLGEKIIHGCIKIMFNSIYKYKDNDRDTLEMNSELLCKLISTCGKLIDTPEGRTYMDTYCIHIRKLSEDPAMVPRIRFMFQNVLELRENNWTPRREENAPKKISEVHADAALKAAMEEEFSNEAQSTSSNNTPKLTTNTKQAVKTTSSPVIADSKKAKKKKNKNPAVKATGDDDIESQITTILKEFLSSDDFKEAKASLRELKSIDAGWKLVENGVTFTLEKNERDRESVSKLFSELNSENFLNQSNFERGFGSVLEILPDLEVDIPFAGKFVGKFIANALSDKSLDQRFLDSMQNDKVKSSVLEFLKK